MAFITNRTSMTTVDQACWGHLRTMRETDRKSIREGDFIDTQGGVLQDYQSTVREWETEVGKIETWVHYHTRYYRVYWGYAGKNKDFLEIVTTDADLDARIREEKIDEILDEVEIPRSGILPDKDRIT